MTLTNYTLNTEIVESVKDKINADWTYGAIGTGTAAESSSDTALGNEVLRKARQETTTTSDSRTVSLWIDSTEANGNTIGEMGFFDAASGGNMFVRHKLASTINKTSDIELWFDVQVTVSCSES